MTPILLALPLLVTIQARGQTSAAPQRPVESTLASYDLRTVIPRWDAATSWSQTLTVPPAGYPDGDLPDADVMNFYGEPGVYEILDLLTQILGDELRHEGSDVSLDGTSLVLLAPPAVHEQVRAVLTALETALSDTITVQVDVLSFAENGAQETAATSNVLSSEEASRLVTTLVGRGAQHREFLLELSAGRTAWIDQRKSVPFVIDYDIEIAQASFVYDPIVVETFDGLRLLLRGVPVDGGVMLSALILQSDLLGEPKERMISLNGQMAVMDQEKVQLIQGPQSLQVPDVLVRALAFDSFMEDGKALLVTTACDIAGQENRQTLLLRRAGGKLASTGSYPIPRTTRTLLVVNSELFRPARFDFHVSPWDGEYDSHPSLVATLDCESSPFFQEWLKYRFSVWRRLGPWALIVTDPAWDQDAPGELERLLAARRPRTRVLASEVSLEAQGATQAIPVHFSLPVLEGSSCAAVIGRTTTTITDFDVEVAQAVSTPDPRVSAIFEGLAIGLTLSGTQGPALTLETRGVARLLDAATGPVDLRYPMMGGLETRAADRFQFDERAGLTLAPGQAARLRIGPRLQRVEREGLAIEISVR